ncbi:hypothetical protein, partial [Enterococcus faecalis]|uniref:hypothetical protein n=1 Tax=Enterococcus faecalis TaxID=1351 RepID=UPI003D6C1ED1
MNPEIKPLMVHHGFSMLEKYVDAAYKTKLTLEESAQKREKQVKGKGGQQDRQVGSFRRLASPTKFERSS